MWMLSTLWQRKFGINVPHVISIVLEEIGSAYHFSEDNPLVCLQTGIDVANDVAEDARNAEVLLNDEISEDFDTSYYIFCTFAVLIYD